jgi:SRSO17 transposase
VSSDWPKGSPHGESQQLHHFISTSPWDSAPLEALLVERANHLVGGAEAVLIIDDTALVKQGMHSVGVARQYCGELGKRANCQSLVSLTLAQAEVPVPVALRLYLPRAWMDDPARCKRAGVPEGLGFRTKGEIALAELDRIRAAGARFGCVLADADYGTGADFRRGLRERGLRYAVGILPTQKVYPLDVALLSPPAKRTGRPRIYPIPSVPSTSAQDLIASLGERAFRKISWREGTRGRLEYEFAALRIRVADAPEMAQGQRFPGEEAWLVCERRASGEQKYYLCNHPPRTWRRTLAQAIKARWSCEQAHQQMKGELGLDHFEGRGWRGLHHHALLSMLAFAFLQHLRLGGKAHAG